MPVRPRVRPAKRARAKVRGSVSLGRLDDFIGVRLRRILNRLSRDYLQRTSRRPVRAGTLNALGVIEANPGISQSEVAHQIGQEASAAGLLFDDLERRGWIVRERLPANRRRYSIRITDTGRATLDRLITALRAAEQGVLSTLGREELRVLRLTLDRLYAECFTED